MAEKVALREIKATTLTAVGFRCSANRPLAVEHSLGIVAQTVLKSDEERRLLWQRLKLSGRVSIQS